MQSTALYMGDLPNWTLQVKGERIGAFHRPVFGRIERRPGATSPTWLATILLLISTIVLALLLVAMLLRKRCRGRGGATCLESTTSSESEEISS